MFSFRKLEKCEETNVHRRIVSEKLCKKWFQHQWWSSLESREKSPDDNRLNIGRIWKSSTDKIRWIDQRKDSLGFELLSAHHRHRPRRSRKRRRNYRHTCFNYFLINRNETPEQSGKSLVESSRQLKRSERKNHFSPLYSSSRFDQRNLEKISSSESKNNFCSFQLMFIVLREQKKEKRKFRLSSLKIWITFFLSFSSHNCRVEEKEHWRDI